MTRIVLKSIRYYIISFLLIYASAGIIWASRPMTPKSNKRAVSAETTPVHKTDTASAHSLRPDSTYVLPADDERAFPQIRLSAFPETQ